MIVDSHCHVSPYWYEPVESLLFQMDRNGVDRGVLIQYMGQYDNEYQFECVKQHPDRLSSVVLIPAKAGDGPAQLEQLVERGATGVRLQPRWRLPGDDPFALWRKAEALGLAVSCSSTAQGFAADAFVEIIEAVPNLPIVLEHLGSINEPDGEEAPYPLRSKIFELARFPNVHIKFHGLGEFSKRAMPMKQPFPFEGCVTPILDMALEAFGPDRLMWGSDFPPVSGREGYANALRFAMQHLESRPQSEREMLFGGNAARLFCGG